MQAVAHSISLRDEVPAAAMGKAVGPHLLRVHEGIHVAVEIGALLAEPGQLLIVDDAAQDAISFFPELFLLLRTQNAHDDVAPQMRLER